MIRLAGVVCSVLGIAVLSAGCKSTPEKELTGQVISEVVDGGFAQVWEATRKGLLDQGLKIYTRDKRGLFVAYSKQRRRIFIFPNRTQLTVTLERVSGNETRVSVETLEQGYRVTLLTYPDWRELDKPAKGDGASVLLESIRSALAAGGEGTASSA